MAWTWIEWLDDGALRAVNAHVTRVAPVAGFCNWLIHTSLFRIGVPVVLWVWLWFRRRNDRVHVRGRLVATLAAALAALVVGRALALALPFRLRPANRPELDFVTMPGIAAGARTWSAFPSDHAAVGFALAIGLLAVSRPLGALALVHVVLLVCAPRLVLGLHHPTDLLAGALLGTLVALLVLRPALRDRLAFPVQRFEIRHPQVFYTAGFVLLMQVSMMFDDVRTLAVVTFRTLRHGL